MVYPPSQRTSLLMVHNFLPKSKCGFVSSCPRPTTLTQLLVFHPLTPHRTWLLVILDSKIQEVLAMNNNSRNWRCWTLFTSGGTQWHMCSREDTFQSSISLAEGLLTYRHNSRFPDQYHVTTMDTKRKYQRRRQTKVPSFSALIAIWNEAADEKVCGETEKPPTALRGGRVQGRADT